MCSCDLVCTCQPVSEILPPVSGKKNKMVPRGSGKGVILNPSPPPRVSPRKNHFLTYFYKDVNELVPITNELKRLFYKGTLQTEICPSTGRPHIHAYLWGKTKRRDTEFKNLPKSIHWEKLHDDKNEIDYARKSETHDGILRVSWGFDEELELINEIDFYDWQKEILTIITNKPVKGVIHWRWEPNGGLGKTAIAKYIVVNHNALVLDGTAADVKNAIVERKEKEGTYPKILIYNLPKSSSKRKLISYEALEQVKDGLFYSGKYHGGMCVYNEPHVIVFANCLPDTDELTARRWDIKEVQL